MTPPNVEPAEIQTLREWVASYGTAETVPIATVTLIRLLDALEESDGALVSAGADVVRLSEVLHEWERWLEAHAPLNEPAEDSIGAFVASRSSHSVAGHTGGKVR